MIVVLLLAGCRGDSWMVTTDDAPVALGEVVSALWWARPEVGDALAVLTTRSVSCDVLRAGETSDPLLQGPTLFLAFLPGGGGSVGVGEYLGGVESSVEVFPESAADIGFFSGWVFSGGESVEATRLPSVATVSSLDDATAEGHAAGAWFEAHFVAEVCAPGFAEDDDCVPTEEVCDGADNDCDAEVDEGVTRTVYVDADGDGHGDPGSAEEGCDGAGHTTVGDDCNDGDAGMFPGNEESCNGVDDDCDGLLDEDGC